VASICKILSPFIGRSIAAPAYRSLSLRLGCGIDHQIFDLVLKCLPHGLLIIELL
jgi:hypothetical protein